MLWAFSNVAACVESTTRRHALRNLFNWPTHIRFVFDCNTRRGFFATFESSYASLALSNELCNLPTNWRSSSRHHTNLRDELNGSGLCNHCTLNAFLLPRYILLAQHNVLQHLVDIPVSWEIKSKAWEPLRFVLFSLFSLPCSLSLSLFLSCVLILPSLLLQFPLVSFAIAHKLRVFI